MPISRRTKWVIWALVAPIAFGVSCFAYGFFRAWHKFVSEERICVAFNPVVSALDRFQHDSGLLPTNLTQLVPRYLQQLPAAPIADSVDYRVLPDGANWQLSIRSRVV